MSTTAGRNVRGELAESGEHAAKSAQEAGRAAVAAGTAGATMANQAMYQTSKIASETASQAMNQAGKISEQTSQLAQVATENTKQVLSGVRKVASNYWDGLTRNFWALGNRVKAALDASPLFRMFVYCFVGLSVIPMTMYATYISVTSTGIFFAAAVIGLIIEAGLGLAGATILLPILGIAFMASSAVVIGYMALRMTLFTLGKITSASGLGQNTLTTVEHSMDKMGGGGVEIKELTGTKYGYHKAANVKELLTTGRPEAGSTTATTTTTTT